MATELTAEAVWEMVADVPDIEAMLENIQVAVTGGIRIWYLQGPDKTIDIEPHMALALITDAMKREMGEDWGGCMPIGVKNWRAYIENEVSDWPGYDAPTEAEAVIAAYKAWKEGK
jgi:hypothetical protein